MPIPGGISIAGVCRNDGHYRRDRGCKDHEARDRGPHKLRREALSERSRGGGGTTSAPDSKEHRDEHAGGDQRAHTQNHETHTLHSLGARKGRCRSGARLQASLTSVRSNLWWSATKPSGSGLAVGTPLRQPWVETLAEAPARSSPRQGQGLRRCGLTRPLSSLDIPRLHRCRIPAQPLRFVRRCGRQPVDTP